VGTASDRSPLVQPALRHMAAADTNHKMHAIGLFMSLIPLVL